MIDTKLFIQNCIYNISEIIQREMFELDRLLDSQHDIEKRIAELRMKKEIYEEYLKEKGLNNAN